jgi:hypothetical protein
MAAAADVAASEPQVIVDPPALQFIDARSRRDDRSYHKAHVPREPAGRGSASGPCLARGAAAGAPRPCQSPATVHLLPSRTAAVTS